MRRLVCACVVRKPPKTGFSRVEAQLLILYISPDRELIAGEKDFRRRMHMRMRRQLKGQEKDRIDETLQKLMEIEEL